MASKHDAKRARENFWVMQQNLAKQKGGRAGYQQRQGPKLPKPKSVAAPASTEEKTEAATPAPEAPTEE